MRFKNGYWIGLIALLLLLLSVSTFTKRNMYNGHERWSSISGVVRETNVRSAGSKGAGIRMYWQHVNYEYSVSGKTLLGNNNALVAPLFKSAGQLESSKTFVSIGEKLSIRVNPLSPSQSCWQCVVDIATINRETIFFAFLSFIMVGLAIFRLKLRTSHDTHF